MLTLAGKFEKINESASVYANHNMTLSSPISGAERPTGREHLRTQGLRNRWAFLCLGVAIPPRQTIDRTAPQKSADYQKPRKPPFSRGKQPTYAYRARVAFDTRTKARSVWPTTRAAATAIEVFLPKHSQEKARQVFNQSQSLLKSFGHEGICGGNGWYCPQIKGWRK